MAQNYYRVTIEIADNLNFIDSVKYGSSPGKETGDLTAQEFGELVYRTLDAHEGYYVGGDTLALLEEEDR